VRKGALRVADAITWLRILLVPIVWMYALLGDGRAVGAGLIAAGLTDYFDGLVARRLAQVTPAGARLDLTADTLVLLSAAAWMGMLHPELGGENPALIAVALLAYFVAVGIGIVNFRKLPSLHLYSSRVAGGLLYAFAVVTFMTGRYDRLLLTFAAGAFILSCVETAAGELLFSVADDKIGSVLLERRRRAEISAVQASSRESKQRSQAPTANVVGSKASPMSSIPTAATPSPNDSGA
jgi:phosphatidylglycerophosphate synthase